MEFVAETLNELREDLAILGQPLVIRIGEIISVLSELHASGLLQMLWSHQETGNGWTYQRDLNVAAWCKAHGIPWHEIQNHGVQRPIASRDGWAPRWDRFMEQPQSQPPTLSRVEIESAHIPSPRDLCLYPDPCAGRQSGGRRGDSND